MDQLRVPATPSSSLLPIPESASNNHNTYQNQEIILLLQVATYWFFVYFYMGPFIVLYF